MSVKTFAAIDVGSFELTMKIFDFSGKNTMGRSTVSVRESIWDRIPMPMGRSAMKKWMTCVIL